MADAPVATFSGGERSRLALAMIVRRRPNLLLLDEPTNHLDLEMRHALTRALAEYEGSLVVVSHDRALLRTVCDGFLLVADGRAVEFDGDVDDYLAWLAARRASSGSAGASPASAPERVERRAQRELAAADRQARLAQRRPLVRETQQLERQIAALEAEKRQLEQRLADADFYASASPAEVQSASRRCAEAMRELGDAEERWLAVQSELEAIGEP
jgi:ATP-binding cassette subfamily F protein 3